MSEYKKAQVELSFGKWPRRSSIPHWTPEEKMIQDVVDAVEKLGAHPRLTDCVTLLGQAREALADWIDIPLTEES